MQQMRLYEIPTSYGLTPSWCASYGYSKFGDDPLTLAKQMPVESAKIAEKGDFVEEVANFQGQFIPWRWVYF